MAQLDRLAEQREGPLAPARTQVSRSMSRVVTAHDGGVRHLLEAMYASLARLQLDEVEQLCLLLQNEVVETQEDSGSVGHRHPGP